MECYSFYIKGNGKRLYKIQTINKSRGKKKPNAHLTIISFKTIDKHNKPKIQIPK